MGDQAIGLLLLRAQLKAESKNVSDIASALRLAKQGEFAKVVVTYSSQSNNLYGYFYLKNPGKLAPVDAYTFLGGLASLLDTSELSRIVFVNSIKGFSSAELPKNRYTVEMDFELGWEQEVFAWYDNEHLLGLASVPGCVDTTRCINLDHAPYSFSFYDLVSTEVQSCGPWVKVRNTAWSDKVRPHFSNVRRTMFSFL
jgi:hypothetical protein